MKARPCSGEGKGVHMPNDPGSGNVKCKTYRNRLQQVCEIYYSGTYIVQILALLRRFLSNPVEMSLTLSIFNASVRQSLCDENLYCTNISFIFG